MTVVPGTSQGGIISIDDVLKATSAEDIVLQAGAKYLIDNNIRVFNHSIQTISKFSDQLHLEPGPEGLSLKALNSSKSAFASIHFKRRFFSDYDVTKIDATAKNLCRISMRSALAIFGRCGTQSDRVQLSCRLQIDPRADYFIAQMSFKHYVTKCYVVPFRDCAVTYKHLFNDKSKLLNQLALQARTLLTVLTQIGSDLDEVKLVATPDRFSIERFFTMDEARARVRRTAGIIDLDVFERYNLQHPSQVAVNLKELKAVLTFADATGLSVNLHFDQPGRPIIVALEENADFTAEFVLATFEGVQNGFDDNAVEEQTAELSQNTAGNTNLSAAVTAEETEEQNNLIEPQRDTFGGDYFKPVIPPDIYNHSSLGLGDGDHTKPNQESMNTEEREDDVESTSKKNNAANNNEFAAADDEILGDEPEPLNAMRDKSIDNETLDDLELNANEICYGSAPAFVDVGKAAMDELHLPTWRSSSKNVAEIPSSENMCEIRECARVVIDEDTGFNLSSWSSKQKQLLDKEKLTSDQMAVMYAELSTLETTSATIYPANEMACIPATSPIYDCINLSCSPTVYLEGERPFHIRLPESQLEHLYQINREMPSQSQQDHEPSTSFVGRILDAAVEKTKPNESRDKSFVLERSFIPNSCAAPVNSDTGNLAPAGHAIGKSLSMEESFLNHFSPNVTELNQLKSAVGQLQNRFGGFKRRPNTQHFSQEIMDLAEQHQFDLFDSSQDWLDAMTQNAEVGELQGSLPHPTSRDIEFNQQEKAQHNREKDVQVMNISSESVSKQSNSPRKTQASALEDVGLPQLQNGTVTKSFLTPRAENNALANVSKWVSRPLAEIERDLHSDNSLDQSLIVETVQQGSTRHDISDDVIFIAESEPSKNPRAFSSRTKLINVCNRFDMDKESNESWLLLERFHREAAVTKLKGTPPITNSKRIPAPIGESFQAPINSINRRPDDNQRTAVAVVTATAEVLDDDGWLRKPNTQHSGTRSIVPSKKSSFKRSQVKRPVNTTRDELDEELESILTSVNKFRDERRRDTYLKMESTQGDENGRQRKRLFTTAIDSSIMVASVSRPLQKKPTMIDQLKRQPPSPPRIESPAVIVITSPTKKQTKK